MARLRMVLDTGDTVAIPNFSLPTAKVATQRRMIRGAKEAEYAEFLYEDDGSGDTTNWGVRTLIVYGVSQSREVDL